ncbi:MAG TPA: hypothetical protein VL947_12085, partial [Cytophagales bacterium]|nr:hypothetical protein [Cytophagales bacterium]
ISAGYPVGVEMNTYDIMDGIYNLQGVNYISLFMDDSLLFDYALETFDYEESHCINAHVDFETLKRKGSWYHKCYVADGNIIKSYKTRNRGFITINDTKNHKVVAQVKDYNGNTSRLEFNISARPHQLFYRVPILKRIFPPKRKMTEQLLENTLKLEYFDRNDNMNLLAEVHSKGKAEPLAPSYVKGNFTTVYMLDLKKNLPDSITICDFVYPLHFKKMIVPKRKQEYTHDNVILQFDEETLYDTLYLRFYKDDRGFVVNDYTIPFQGSLGVKINELHALEDKLHTAAFADGGRGRLAFAGGKWSSDSTSLYYKTKGPGAYTLARDIAAPTLKVTKKNKKEIQFKASDPGSGIAKYECYVNGQWVLMNYDYKRSLFWSEKLNPKVPFKGELLIRVADNLGNVREQKHNIK